MKEDGKRTYNPESKPAWPLVELEESFWQGLVKGIECLVALLVELKVIVLPGCTVIFKGSNNRLVPPTMTL